MKTWRLVLAPIENWPFRGGVYRSNFDQVIHVSCLILSRSKSRVYYMSTFAKVRRLFHRDHLSISEIQRRTSLSCNTIKAYPI
jgi:hypothetical protein